MRGVITNINQRGFGFIRPDGAERGSKDLFFHARALRGGLEFDSDLECLAVTFDLVEAERGPRCENVRPAL